ncbi:K-box transcription factor [Trema orientale]|uniref:K-box transcription factor n=1 Tax=Trema orientale TaxID=63057 RepID=A0A2P5F7T9_TREOI|nr:K-box transcription factor [Trema orientale]
MGASDVGRCLVLASLGKILERYGAFDNEGESSDKLKAHDTEYDGLWANDDVLNVMSNLKIEELTTNELTHLERQLDSTLKQTRLRKTELRMETITTLSQKEKQLREENQFLENKVETIVGDRGKQVQLSEINDHAAHSMRRKLQLYFE